MKLYINFGQNPSLGSGYSIRKENFGQNLTFQSVAVTLFLGHQNLILTMYLCKFGQNPPTGSGDMVPKRLILTVFIGW